MPKLTNKNYLSRTDEHTDHNYRKASLLKTTKFCSTGGCALTFKGSLFEWILKGRKIAYNHIQS